MKAAKRILRYVKGTFDYGLIYSIFKNYELIGYSDNDWGGDIDNKKNTFGFHFCIGDIAFTWSLKKQLIVTLLTCEAEYVVVATCVCHAKIVEDDAFGIRSYWIFNIDNRSAINFRKESYFSW